MKRPMRLGMVFTMLASVCLGMSISHAYEEVEVTNGGTVAGKVIFKGKADVNPALKVTKDNSHCGTQKPNEELVVSGDGRVKNAVITIENIGKGKKISREDSSLDNKDCSFVPHVQAMAADNYLEIVNSDPILHNTHGYLDGTKTVFNLGMPLQGQKIKKKMKKAGLISIKCDAGHTWMSAYIVVADHPYFALTDAHGVFEIKDVPPGKYQVKAWHEKLGTQTIEITVPEKGKVESVFDTLAN